MKRGRLREFLQCDVDVVGIEGPEAEAELMQIAAEMFKKLGLPVIMRWNNRRFLAEMLEAVGVAAAETPMVMLTLDKIEKAGAAGVVKELSGKGLAAEVTGAITELIGMGEPSFGELSEKYNLGSGAGAHEVLALQRLIDELELDAICKFDPFLARGLSFYTGTVYEIFDANKSFASSLGGGGRYDSIIGKLVGREDIRYPTAGLSFGMESIMELIKERPQPLPQPLAVVMPIGETAAAALKTAAAFRSSGIRTAVESNKRKLKKSLAAVAAKGIRYAILIGEDEAKAGKVRIKDMEERTELVVSVQEAIERILRTA